MMVPKKSLILAGAALALFGASASAQSQSGKVFMRYNKPLKNVTLDLATGTVTHGPTVNNKAATTTVDFNNNDLGGFVGVDTGGSFCEWFDSATKGFAGNNSDLMNDIVFAFCTSKLYVGSGGPGGSVKLGFYEGYTLFGGAPTTAVAVFTLTGLPGNSASSSFFGGFNCYFIRVFFGNLVCFADGNIGYSWKFLDTGTTGVLAGTWPFLSCVTSCSGAILQVDGQGMTDAIDEYCPPGTLRATFTFGTTQGSFTSMSMDVREATDVSATNTAYNACTTPNPSTLSSVSTRCDGSGTVNGGAVVGGTWTATVTRGTGTGGTWHLLVKVSKPGNCNGIPYNGAGSQAGNKQVLVSGASLSSLGNFPIVGASGSNNFPIPSSLGFICIHYFAQAYTIGGSPGGIRLTSAIEGTVGTGD
jgi:hypothetical protein